MFFTMLLVHNSCWKNCMYVSHKATLSETKGGPAMQPIVLTPDCLPQVLPLLEDLVLTLYQCLVYNNNKYFILGLYSMLWPLKAGSGYLKHFHT